MGLSHPDDDNTQVEDIDEHILYAISYAHLNHIYFVSSKIKPRLNNIKKNITQQDFNKLPKTREMKEY